MLIPKTVAGETPAEPIHRVTDHGSPGGSPSE
jgi:hypothetical protein